MEMGIRILVIYQYIQAISSGRIFFYLDIYSNYINIYMKNLTYNNFQ